jgi:sulfur carrier protein
MDVVVNGKPQLLPRPQSLEGFLRALDLPPLESGITVAVNGELVRKTEWQGRFVKLGDELEIVQAAQGVRSR